eukprot:Polyplicarium_translucidae@DN1784_c0_g1_i2.p1
MSLATRPPSATRAALVSAGCLRLGLVARRVQGAAALAAFDALALNAWPHSPESEELARRWAPTEWSSERAGRGVGTSVPSGRERESEASPCSGRLPPGALSRHRSRQGGLGAPLPKQMVSSPAVARWIATGSLEHSRPTPNKDVPELFTRIRRQRVQAMALRFDSLLLRRSVCHWRSAAVRVGVERLSAARLRRVVDDHARRHLLRALLRLREHAITQPQDALLCVPTRRHLLDSIIIPGSGQRSIAALVLEDRAKKDAIIRRLFEFSQRRPVLRRTWD